ncbi:Hypothetical protein PHPALM_5596 [Phytophthora palmivora]|uniref:Jacalin-type lectin domain-containing protein n=1 Tax=Phytophthora palmivora TaxID=4796 RepID=A0A2P4YGZ3_9STRA|nr:Hypothetical protein PHPALM_5596 [Phytophthora palmivora]
MLGPRPSSVQERTAYEWRRKLQRDYSYAQACAEDLQKKAKREVERIVGATEVGVRGGRCCLVVHVDGITLEVTAPTAETFSHGGPGGKENKLALGPGEYITSMEAHPGRLKPRALFPKRPTVEVEVSEDDDFDAALLPEDSWEPDAVNDEYEVERILDLRWTKRTRTSRRIRHSIGWCIYR